MVKVNLYVEFILNYLLLMGCGLIKIFNKNFVLFYNYWQLVDAEGINQWKTIILNLKASSQRVYSSVLPISILRKISTTRNAKRVIINNKRHKNACGGVLLYFGYH